MIVPKRARPAATRITPAGVAGFLLLGLAAAMALPFSGCEGGTTSETGNPELVIGFRKQGKPAGFAGTMEVFAADADPAFFTPGNAPGSPPKVVIGSHYRILGDNFIITNPGRGVLELEKGFLAAAARYRLALPMLPHHVEDAAYAASAEAGDAGPGGTFNLAFEDRDSTMAFIRGLSLDAQGTRILDSAGTALDTLWVDLGPPGTYAGTIDTTGLGDAPLVIYAPGSPYYARVNRGGRFDFQVQDIIMPRGPLPVRLVTARGWVFPIAAPLDVRSSPGGYVPDTLPPLVPGPRADSLALPPALEVLATPIATPAGPHQFTDSLVVTLSGPPGAIIAYTLDGTPPLRNSERYSRPLVLRASATLTAVAFRAGAHPSLPATNNYTLVPPAPRAQPASRAFTDSLRVVLSVPKPGATIHYTLDGSEPGTASPVYTAPLVIRATTVLKAATNMPGLGLSRVAEERYVLATDTVGAAPR